MRTSAFLLALALVTGSGCAAPLAAHLAETRLGEARPGSEKGEPLPNGPRAASVRKAAQQPVSQEEAFAGILHQLQDIRAIDPEAERQLMADLKEAKPEHYPMIVEAFSTARAYRQQLAARQERENGEPRDETMFASDDPLVKLTSHESTWPSEGESAVRASAVSESLTKRVKRDDAARYADSVKPRRYADATPQVTNKNQPTEKTSTAAAGQPTAERRAAAADDAEVAVASDVSVTRPSAKPAAVTPAVAEKTGDWQADLDRSIADMEKSISPKPTSIGEMHDHMRLRTLQLLAGRQEDAFKPIPGASADQQDYWSKQLFAMSAYLDANSTMDDKQRSSAALKALDEARAKLADLSTLQVRNAAFVTSVDGFGAYEPAKSTKFEPGQKVALYAEVENFRSNSAQDGYHTALATSYQVLEAKTGRRVEGKQFPDVADKCRNRRRDFHMQYEFPLPTRIYPGEYQLELTITDHNSGKIGQTTLPFEIVGE